MTNKTPTKARTTIAGVGMLWSDPGLTVAPSVKPDAFGEPGDALVDSLWGWTAEVKIRVREELVKLSAEVDVMTVVPPSKGRVMLRSEVPVTAVAVAEAKAKDLVSIRWGRVK